MKQIVEELRSSLHINGTISMQQYLEGLKPSKRAQYSRGLEYFRENLRIRSVLNAQQKGDETQPRKCKPRQLWEPSFELRALLGMANKNIMTHSKLIEPAFIQGYTPAELDLKLETVKELHDPVALSLDFSSYDSHARYPLIKAIDGAFKSLIADVFIDTEYASFIPQIEEQWDKIMYRFTVSLKGGLYPGLQGRVKETTFSGLPHRTTLGNTWRSILMIKYALRNIPKEAYRLFVAGDDILLFIERAYYEQATAEMRKVFATDEPILPTKFGLAQVVKTYKASDCVGEFLSKVVLLDEDGVSLVRKPDRVRIMSNFMSTRSLLTRHQHNIAVNFSLYTTASYDRLNSLASVIPGPYKIKMTEELMDKITHSSHSKRVSDKIWWYLTNMPIEYFEHNYNSTMVIPDLNDISDGVHLPERYVIGT